MLGAKARAVLHGRFYVSRDDIRAVAHPVLRHRIMTNFNAEAEGDQARRHHPPADRHRPRVVGPTQERAPPAGASPRTYLDPQTLAKLKGLQLRARHIVEGYVAGLHRSPYHGFSIEFAEHREYAPGDDLRYLDWKVFGRTDKFYLKQYRGRDEPGLLPAAGHQREHALSRARPPRCRSSSTPSASPPRWPT